MLSIDRLLIDRLVFCYRGFAIIQRVAVGTAQYLIKRNSGNCAQQKVEFEFRDLIYIVVSFNGK